MSLRASIRKILAQLLSWFRAAAQRGRLEHEMDAELADHLQRLTDDLIRAGHSPADAARRARVALGPALAHKEEMRASLGLRWWDELWADLRYAVRLLRKSPGFTLIAAASLALAIGANTTIFSIAKEVMYDHLGVPHPEQLRLFKWVADQNNIVRGFWGNMSDGPNGESISPEFTYPVYEQLRQQNRSLGSLFAFKQRQMNATIRGNAQRVETEMVSGNYFAELGVRPQIGRAIQPSDDAVIGAGTVAVISDGLWERAFARSPAALGQIINLNQSALTIVGVNPRGFTGAANPQITPDVFVPLSMQPLISPMGKSTSLLVEPNTWWIEVMGRLKPGVSERDAQAVLNAQMEADIRATIPIKAGETIPRLQLTDGSRGLNDAARELGEPVNVLMALTGFVLLLACANIANLLLARSAQRQREISVRMAVGANRGRIVRQMLTESLLLAAMGGIAGLLVGYLGRDVLPSLMFNSWQSGGFSVQFDWGVFAFAAGVTIVTGLVFGLAPAWSAAGTEVGSSLKETAQTATRRRRGLGGKAIVVFQIALSTLLVIGAGLFLRTLFALNSIDVGFRTDHLLLFQIDAPAQRYPSGKDLQLFSTLEQSFGALPGVDSVTLAQTPYIADSMGNRTMVIEGETPDPKKRQSEDVNWVGNTFFQTLGIPIVAGRGFGPQDTATSPRVAVINESLARERFPHENPIGKRFTSGDAAKDGWTQIVGICADTRYNTLREAPPPQHMMPYVQNPKFGSMTFEIRTRFDAAALTPVLRSALQQIDRDLPMIDIRTEQQQIDATMRMERVFAVLTGGFGLVALALACVGIYGIMAYSVANRRNEIGIRMALGAQPSQVRGMILRESTWLAVAGIVAGVGAALLLTRLVKSMLFGIHAYDPVTMAGGVFILLAVALAAAWIPARRAAGVQPMEALRHE